MLCCVIVGDGGRSMWKWRVRWSPGWVDRCRFVIIESDASNLVSSDRSCEIKLAYLFLEDATWSRMMELAGVDMEKAACCRNLGWCRSDDVHSPPLLDQVL